MEFRLGVICNGSDVENIYSVGRMTSSPLRTELMLMSLYHIRSVRFSDCLSFIPLKTIDVTALVEPFEPEVWCLVVATVVLLGVAWTLIERESAPIFCTEITLSTVTVREVTFTPKRYSGAMIGLVALAFAFIVGHIYSNTVMSSFLDPTFEIRKTSNVFTCTGDLNCYNETYLNFLLARRPVCDLPSPMRGTARKPLKRFRPRKALRYEGGFEFVNLEKTSGPQTVYMRLSVTRISVIFSRLEQHGVLSPATLVIQDEKFIRQYRDRAKMSDSDPKNPDPVSDYKRNYAARHRALNPAFEYVEFNTTRDVFDMSSFCKIQPLSEICFLLILAAICLELCHVRRAEVYAFCYAEAERLVRTVQNLLSCLRECLTLRAQGMCSGAADATLAALELWRRRRTHGDHLPPSAPQV